MKHCPITNEVIADNERYSTRGLRWLSPRLISLAPLPYTAQQQREEAIARAGKMSIQGVQTKLSMTLNIKEQAFEIVDSKGNFILKTQSASYKELPENEALTMSLAATIGLEVPVHGLIYSADNSMAYFIKRFDRLPGRKKLAVEDFAQLSNLDRDTKYNSSMENVAKVVAQYCSFPIVEFVKLFKLSVFNFLIGNEDMHLKNFSLITRDNKITLSPAYDLLNSTSVTGNTKEEFALPLNGRKNNITRNNLFKYFANERLGLNEKIINEIAVEFHARIPLWRTMIEQSFLSPEMKKRYLELLNERQARLGL